jgi:hypothetical protein
MAILGKSYAEFFFDVVTSPASIGVVPVSDTAGTGALHSQSTNVSYRAGGNKRVLGTESAYGASWAANDIIGVAVDPTANTIEFFKNGTSQGVITSSAFFAQGNCTFAVGTDDVGSPMGYANFGQRAFTYTPPTGFLALNTQNLPEPSIKKPSAYMDVVLWTGNGTSRTISGLGFSPDLVWAKGRSTAESHRLYDTVRGATQGLYSNLTNAESTESQSLTAFNSDGFTLGTNAPNTNSFTYVAWCWDESATPGFDIVTYTGNGTNRTIAHSLGVAPKFIITKSRTTADDWFCYHDAIGNTKYILLDSTAASATSSTIWNNTSPTSSTFSLGTSGGANRNGDNFVAYCFSEVAGFSKFGSYTGNNSTDGPFVHCGFRPRYVLVKDTISAGYWGIFDAVRSSYNVGNQYLQAQSSSAEDSTYPQIDFLSNGFKLRANNATSAQNNLSGNTYIFAAFAESPFKYSLAR